MFRPKMLPGTIKRSSEIFFFQAEDGIRYLTVTGVQTCALPICPRRREAIPGGPPRPGRADHARRPGPGHRVRRPPARPPGRRAGSPPALGVHGPGGARSEERRVGKECGAPGGRREEADYMT